MVDFSYKNHHIIGSANVISRCLGLAMIDKKERYLASYPAMVNALKDATLSAKRERLGMYELGVYLLSYISSSNVVDRYHCIGDIGDDDE
jgi:hypothetical protein